MLKFLTQSCDSLAYGSFKNFLNVKNYINDKGLQLFTFLYQQRVFYTCISGKRERRRHNKKVYMVITILSAAGKKGILKLTDLASLQFNNQVL